jgi:hypothetical protein
LPVSFVEKGIEVLGRKIKLQKLDEIHDSLQNMMSAHNCWHETRGKEK